MERTVSSDAVIIATITRSVTPSLEIVANVRMVSRMLNVINVSFVLNYPYFAFCLSGIEYRKVVYFLDVNIYKIDIINKFKQIQKQYICTGASFCLSVTLFIFFFFFVS